MILQSPVKLVYGSRSSQKWFFCLGNPEVDYCLSATAVRVLQTTDPNIRVLGFRTRKETPREVEAVGCAVYEQPGLIRSSFSFLDPDRQPKTFLSSANPIGPGLSF